MRDTQGNHAAIHVLCPTAMEKAVFYVAPTTEQTYAVIAESASRSGCVATYTDEEEAERQCDLLNRMSGVDDELEDLPEEMFELLDQLR